MKSLQELVPNGNKVGPPSSSLISPLSRVVTVVVLAALPLYLARPLVVSSGGPPKARIFPDPRARAAVARLHHRDRELAAVIGTR